MAHDPFYDLVSRPPEPVWGQVLGGKGAVALLTIDLQYLDAHPAGWMGRLARMRGRADLLQPRWDAIAAILPNVRRLQNAFRDASARAGAEVMPGFVNYSQTTRFPGSARGTRAAAPSEPAERGGLAAGRLRVAPDPVTWGRAGGPRSQADSSRALEVMHVRVAYRTRDGRDAGKAYMPDPTAEPIPRDTRDDEFLAEVAPLGDEIIFNKTSASVFNSTAIDGVLHRMGIEHLVVTGIVTDGCVELSARDAADRGYSVILVSDGCAASTPEAHADALARMTDGGFIVAKTTAQVLALLPEMVGAPAMTRGRERAVMPTQSREDE